jgi:Protein of unknown function (DUF993)
MKTNSIRLPVGNGDLTEYTLQPRRAFATVSEFHCRTAYAAAHVVADPLAENGLGIPANIDWEATLRFREHLWSLGFGVAEAMDTAQRGMGLDWTAAKELIRRSCLAASSGKHQIVCGAGTDQLSNPRSLSDVAAAYDEQCDWIEQWNGQVVIMASRSLTAIARSFDDYQQVYSEIVGSCKDRVILHWLGPMFDPALTGYWGSTDLDIATENFLTLLNALASKIAGVKISLLDKDREIGIRRRLPPGIALLTGDDFSYPELILGDEAGFSHALLGFFDAIAPAASAAFGALDRGDRDGFLQILNPTVPLARHIFQEPTYHYKTGLVFLAYLNGLQAHFRMIGGMESARSVAHVSRLFILADQAGLLLDRELAVERMQRFLALAGQCNE